MPIEPMVTPYVTQAHYDRAFPERVPMRHVFPASPPKPANSELLIAQLTEAKGLLSMSCHDGHHFRYVCNVLENIEALEAKLYIESLIDGYFTVCHWWTAAVRREVGVRQSYPSDIVAQVYRQAWLDHMIKELSA